jgi:hypothetical protein
VEAEADNKSLQLELPCESSTNTECFLDILFTIAMKRCAANENVSGS